MPTDSEQRREQREAEINAAHDAKHIAIAEAHGAFDKAMKAAEKQRAAAIEEADRAFIAAKKEIRARLAD